MSRVCSQAAGERGPSLPPLLCSTQASVEHMKPTYTGEGHLPPSAHPLKC